MVGDERVGLLVLEGEEESEDEVGEEEEVDSHVRPVEASGRDGEEGELKGRDEGGVGGEEEDELLPEEVVADAGREVRVREGEGRGRGVGKRGERGDE